MCLVDMDQGVYVCVCVCVCMCVCMCVCVCERERVHWIKVCVVCGRSFILDLYEKDRS